MSYTVLEALPLLANESACSCSYCYYYTAAAAAATATTAAAATVTTRTTAMYCCYCYIPGSPSHFPVVSTICPLNHKTPCRIRVHSRRAYNSRKGISTAFTFTSTSISSLTATATRCWMELGKSSPRLCSIRAKRM